MTASEMGKRGGASLKAKVKDNPDYFRELGRKGGKKTADTHGKEYYSAMGKKGGEALRAQRGDEFYEEIGKVGGLESRKRAKEKRSQ